MVNGITGGVVGQAAVDGAKQREKTLDAARQFESLLMAQMLKTMRQAGSGGWLGTGDDQAGASAMELAEEHLAQALAAGGGLGLTRMISDGLIKDETDRQKKAENSTAGAQSVQGTATVK